MILLVSSIANAHKCASTLQQELRTRAQAADSAQEATALLRQHEFEVSIVDEALVENHPAAVDAMLRLAAGAVPVFMNPAVCGMERLVREAGSALRRRSREQHAAYDAALRAVRLELKSEVTGILLSAQLALDAPPDETTSKLKCICELAERMKHRLQA